MSVSEKAEVCAAAEPPPPPDAGWERNLKSFFACGLGREKFSMRSAMVQCASLNSSRRSLSDSKPAASNLATCLCRLSEVR